MKLRLLHLRNLDPRHIDYRKQSLRLLARVEKTWPRLVKRMPKKYRPYARKLENRVRALLEMVPSSVKANPTRFEAEATDEQNPIIQTAEDFHQILEIRSRGASRWAIYDKGPEAPPLKVFKNRSAAVQAGKRMAKTRHAELRIFNQRGAVQNSFYH